MQAIQEIFSVDVKEGIKSVFKKDSRRETVESMAMVSWALADFILKFTKVKVAVFDWPMIKCGKQYFHPIHYNEEKLPNLKETEITPIWDIQVAEKTIPWEAKINKKGDLICFTQDGAVVQNVDHKSGELQPYYLSLLNDWAECQHCGNVIGLAVDEDDALYAVSYDDEDGYELFVYSVDGKNTHHCTLKFLKEKRFSKIKMNVNNKKEIVIGLTL